MQKKTRILLGYKDGGKHTHRHTHKEQRVKDMTRKKKTVRLPFERLAYVHDSDAEDDPLNRPQKRKRKREKERKWWSWWYHGC